MSFLKYLKYLFINCGFNPLTDKKIILILVIWILLAGSSYRIILTSENNFIFNMDNARDLVDVREMVLLKQPRLIGPTSAISGVYNGPFWYYLLAITFIIGRGSPYAPIIIEIILWAIGGIFLLSITRRFGLIPELAAGLLWIFSPPIVLASMYAFNPNPIIFLTPMLLYYFEKYFLFKSIRYSIIVWFLMGIFNHFEINAGIFLPLIFILTAFLYKSRDIFKRGSFWMGIAIYLLTFTPQLFFDLRHDFIMIHSLINFFIHPVSTNSSSNFYLKENHVIDVFQNVLTATFLNSSLLTWILILAFIIFVINLVKQKTFTKDLILLISTLYIIVPLIGYLIVPTTLNLWHLGGVIVASIIICSSLLKKLFDLKNIFRFASFILVGLFLFLLTKDILSLGGSVSPDDPSNFKNELESVDYTFQYSKGENFTAYAFLPSVIDYPYQYIFWWRGLNKYGYLPKDYAYLPNQPEYITNKSRLNTGTNPPNSNLIFLIEEPDSNNTRVGWEQHFENYRLLSQTMVGAIKIEVKK